MTKRLRYLLPALATLIAAPLLGWNLHLDQTRIFYDTGAPLWPYSAPTVLLATFDLPVLVLARPFANLFHAYFGIPHAAIILILTALVWLWIGEPLDKGLLRPPYSRPKLLASLVLLLALALVTVIIGGFAFDLAYWRQFGFHFIEPMLEPIAAFPSLVAMTVCCVLTARKLFRADHLTDVASARGDHRVTNTAMIVWLAAWGLAPIADAVQHFLSNGRR